MIYGNMNLWTELFPDDLIGVIVELILRTWKKLPQQSCNEKEVPITIRLCKYLREDKNRSRLPFRIEVESTEIDDAGNMTGRIDLKFSAGLKEDVYFAFECKRMNIYTGKKVFHSLADEYVNNGVMRFISGQYASGLDKGGMLAYVMDGNIDKALTAVRGQLKKKKAKLFIQKDLLRPSSVKPSCCQLHETRHNLSKNFLIHHLFLPFGEKD